MDAAQKLLRIAALLFVISMLMTAPGWAAPATLVVSPTTLTMGNTGRDFVSVNSSDASAVSFTATSSQTWLTVTGTLTTPTQLQFQLYPVPAPGAAATVTLHPSNGSPDVLVNVTYSPNSGGGNGTLSYTPNPFNMSASAGNNSGAYTVTIATSGTGTATLQSVTSNSTWLSGYVTNAAVSPGSPGSISLTASALGLTSGQTYQGSVTVGSTAGSLTVNVNFTVGAGGGGGSLTVSTTSITWSFNSNSGVFPYTDVTVTPPAGATYYSVSTSSSANWLTPILNGSAANPLQQVPIGTSFRLGLTGAVNSLPAGTVSGTATVTDSFGDQASILVTLNVNGGSTPGFNISPASVSFSSAVGGPPQVQTVTMSSTQGGHATVGPYPNAPAWLVASAPSVDPVSANQSTTFTITVSPGGLAANTYTASIPVAIGTQTATVAVNLVVGGGGTGTTAVAPTALTFAYQAGTNASLVVQQKLVITGPAGAWSATTNVTTPSGGNWLSIIPASGSALPDPTIDGQAPIVSVNPTGLMAGSSYTGSITVTTPGGIQTIQVTLAVSATAILIPNLGNSGDLIFNATTGQGNPASRLISFSGSDSTLPPNMLAISAFSNTPWISIGGTAASQVSVLVDQTGLGTGVYSGSITVTQAGAANSPLTVPVVLVVNGGGSGGSTTGTFGFSPSSIAFSSVGGTTPAATNLYVTSASGTNTAFIGDIRYASGSNPTNWLSVNQALGNFSGTTPVYLSVAAVPTGLAAGTYYGFLDIAANTTSASQTINVTLTVSATGSTGNVTVTPTSLSFAALTGASPANQTLSVSSASGSAGVSFTVVATTNNGGNWLSTNVGTGATPLNPLTVIVNSSSLLVGTYSGNIQISPNGGQPVNVPVSLSITAAAGVSATPTSLTFTYRNGDIAPAAQPLSVIAGGGGTSLGFTVTTTTASGGNWLVATPAIGNTPNSVSVSINTANITGVGNYTGTVLVAGASGAVGSTIVSVSLSVTAPLPTVTAVTNAGSYASGSISPGEIITLFSPKDGSRPIGPATPVGLTLDSTGKVATTLGGTQVLINGTPCPITFASALQVNAVVPYEVKGFVNATVLVNFLGQRSNGVTVSVATTVPGLFTQNASGTGPGAIQNSNITTNSPGNPAARGDVVVVYLTGEGETSPSGVTGKVTTVASAPPLTPAPLLPVSVTIGGQPAQWTFAGEAPSLVSGVLQVNVVVPTNIAPGDQSIVVSVGGNQSQQGVTVSVK
jgi:uncharacterized protein (TIGR03437 family)